MGRKYIPDFAKYAPAQGGSTRSARASDILSYGVESITSLYNLFERERKRRGSKRGGYTTHAEQDLLRSMLIFGGATLDSVVKQVLRDQIPNIEKLPPQARTEFKKFISKQLSKGATVNVDALASSLVNADPRVFFIEEYVKDLTGDSLQSKNQLFRAAVAVGLDMGLDRDGIKTLDLIFEARNEIIHELDYLAAKEKKKQRNRRNRSRDEIIRWTEELLRISGRFTS